MIDKEYAEDFVRKGVIHLSNPKIWRDKNVCNGLQLDEDDGCFCFSNDINDQAFDSQGRNYLRVKKDGGWKYFENTDLIVGSCFYGILKSCFTENSMKYGVRTVDSKNYCVSVDYFNQFNAGSANEKKTIIILDMYRFYDLMIEALVKLGAQRNEIYFSMVYYVNKSIPFATTERFPFEYFLKDASFSSQTEFRLIVASENIEFYKRLQNNYYNLVLGDISSFSIIQDKYDTDLEFSIQNDKLIYKLSKPMILTMDQRSFAQLITELYQIIQNQLPGEPRDPNDLASIASLHIGHIKSKYGVDFRDDGRLYNVPKDLYDTLPEIYKGFCMTII